MTNGSGNQGNFDDWAMPNEGVWDMNPPTGPQQATSQQWQASAPQQPWQPQPKPQPASQPSPENKGSSKTPYIVAISVLSTLLVAGGIWFATTQIGDDGKSGTTAAESNSAAGAAGETNAATPAAPAIKRGTGVQSQGTQCTQSSGDGLSVTVNAATSVTSCEFAMNVAKEVGKREEPDAGDTFTLQASSPKTGQTYSMSCVAAGTPVNEINCSGGNNAKVQVIIADTAS